MIAKEINAKTQKRKDAKIFIKILILFASSRFCVFALNLFPDMESI